MVSESGLLARLAARAADLAERGQPAFTYSTCGTVYANMSTPGIAVNMANSAYYAFGSTSTTGYATLHGNNLASALAESSYVLGWTFTDQPAYAVASAFAQATYSLAASADKTLSDYSDDAPQGSVIHEQIKLAIDMLLTELSARIDDACQRADTSRGAVAAAHRSESKSPELVWNVITALLAALTLLLTLMIYFFPPD